MENVCAGCDTVPEDIEGRGPERPLPSYDPAWQQRHCSAPRGCVLYRPRWGRGTPAGRDSVRAFCMEDVSPKVANA